MAAHRWSRLAAPARAGALALALLAAAPRAHAGNFDGAFIGNDAALAAGAVVARDGTGDAAWHDPAGLATLERDRVDVSATVFALRAQTLDNIIRSQLPDDHFASDLESNELLVIPSTLIATYRLCDGVTGAIGFFTPHQEYISSSSLVTSDLGNPLRDATSLYQQRVDLLIDEVDYQVTAAVGWQVEPTLRVGFGFYGVYASVSERLVVGISLPALPPSLTDPAFGSATLETSADSYGFELGAGVQWDFAPDWTAALAIRSPDMSLYRKGRSAVLVTSDSGSSAGEFGTTVEEFSDFAFDLVSPGRISLGVQDRTAWGWAAAQVDVDTALSQADFAIDRRTVVNGRAGFAYRYSDAWTLGGGFYTDIGAGADRNEVGDRNIDYYGLTAGVEHSSYFALKDDPRPDALTMRTVVALRYGYGTGQASALDITVTEDGNIDLDTAKTNVDLTVHEVALYIGAGLDY